MYGTSDEAVVTITPNGPMAVLGPDCAQVVFVLQLGRVHVTYLRLCEFIVSVPVSTILARANGSVRLCYLIIAARCSNGSVFGQRCNAVGGAI